MSIMRAQTRNVEFFLCPQWWEAFVERGEAFWMGVLLVPLAELFVVRDGIRREMVHRSLVGFNSGLVG